MKDLGKFFDYFGISTIRVGVEKNFYCLRILTMTKIFCHFHPTNSLLATLSMMDLKSFLPNCTKTILEQCI